MTDKTDSRDSGIKLYHDEVSRTIRKVFLTLIGTCTFCVVTLTGTPDRKLLTGDAVVELPILNYPMSFSAFLVIGPIAIIALTVYLHTFIGEHQNINLPLNKRIPILPNFETPISKILSNVIFYWMVPITLALFVWKSDPHRFGDYVFYFATIATIILVGLQFRRCPISLRSRLYPVLMIATTAYFGGLYLFLDARIYRLANSDLSNSDFRGIDLSNAFMVEVNLRNSLLNGSDVSDANMSKAVLIRANISGSDMSRAKLWEADLSDVIGLRTILNGAFLGGANLSRATLHGVFLRDSDLHEADLSNAKFGDAHFDSASLIKVKLMESDLTRANLCRTRLQNADLTGATLKYTNLRNADLDHAILRNAVLVNADLTGASLAGADFAGADLTGARLFGARLIHTNQPGASVTQDQIDKTCGDSNTRLPGKLRVNICEPPIYPNGPPACHTPPPFQLDSNVWYPF